MKTITRYEAFDGKPFDTAEECKAYEADNVVARMIGLTADQVQTALERTDVDLADAIEAVASRIIKKRYEQGDKRRTRKIAAEVEPSDAALAPARRGDRDFKAGKPGVIPDDLKGDADKAEAYMAAWDKASVATARAAQVAA